MWQRKILGYFGLFVLCSANQRLLIDQLRWEFVEFENELRVSSRIFVFIYGRVPLGGKSQKDAELSFAQNFNTFDQNLNKIPENLLYGTEAIRQFPQFLSLFSELNNIYNTYEKFRVYLKQTLNGTRCKIAIEDLNYDIENNKTGVSKAIERVNDLAYNDWDTIRKKMNEMFEENYWCKNTNQSPQQVSYNLYNLIGLAQLKAYVLQQFVLFGNMLWGNNEVSTNSSVNTQMRFENNVTNLMQNLMSTKQNPTDIWRCDPKLFIEGINYDKFTTLLQGHINLRPVFADFKTNSIVTGLKLEKHNRLLHLKIQEGQLLPYGYINQSTVHWVDVDNYTITDQGVSNGKDYFTMTDTQRSMALDDITVHNKNHVLTGVRFTVQNDKIHFNIHVSPFDWHTGRAKHEDGYYIYETSIDNRRKINLDDSDIPIETTKNSLMVPFDPKSYVEFTHTSLSKDAAQTTIPYIDIQSVINQPAVPLVGAGIYYKGNKGFGGFIAPKIKTYDFEQHMSTAISGMLLAELVKLSNIFH